MSSESINRLSTLLQQLVQQAKATDDSNAKRKSHKVIENNNLFSLSLFVTQSDRFIPYAKEIERKIAELARLLSAKQLELASALLIQIEQQLSAFMNALNANQTMHNEAKFRLDAKIQSIKARQYKKAAQAVMQSTHQLYKKLTEHHEFERRLLVMLKDKESELSLCAKSKNQSLSTEVLVLHQRLGRCRKAISTIERDIEFSEKR